jgi:hypothetical protein
VAVPDDEFETMLARARSFRRRVAELGSVSGPVIEQHVRERLRWRPTTSTLPPAQGELAEEIIELIEAPRLSPQQTSRLEREFFGH